MPSEPWVERETSWHNYYLRSSLTYDSFFREKILSQGHVYQYLMGFQGAARDPLQHTLPFVFSDPAIVKGYYSLHAEGNSARIGSLPYAMVGSGVPMPAIFHPSDQEMWLLWAASEYVLATARQEFSRRENSAVSSRNLQSGRSDHSRMLQRTYGTGEGIGVGQHGLMRLSNGDWNDEVVVMRGSADTFEGIRKVGESVLNAAMASYVLDHYARMLNYWATEGRGSVESQSRGAARSGPAAGRGNGSARLAGTAARLAGRRSHVAGTSALGDHRRSRHAGAAQNFDDVDGRIGARSFADRRDGAEQGRPHHAQ